MDLLFERFLSEERGEWPDIDLDLPSGERREAVIQYVYQRYGRHGAGDDRQRHHLPRPERGARGGQGARASADDAATGSPSLVANWGYQDPDERARQRIWPRPAAIRATRASGASPRSGRASQDLPRHLGQHSGGMVIAAGRLDDVVPLEPATMPGRVVVQWDKDDCAELGIVKVDLLGLGMMSVLQDSLTLVRETGGRGRSGAAAAG